MNAPTLQPANAVIADTLQWLAVLLEIDERDGRRVLAYRRAARAVGQLDRPVGAVLAELGRPGLEQLGIAPGIAQLIAEWDETGELPLLEVAHRRAHGLWPALAKALCHSLGIPSKPRKLHVPLPIRRSLGESWN